MRLTFIGADHEVTGSCHLLQACGLNILVDCGMEQGINKFENAELPIIYSDVDYVLVTHSHIVTWECCHLFMQGDSGAR